MVKKLKCPNMFSQKFLITDSVRRSNGVYNFNGYDNNNHKLGPYWDRFTRYYNIIVISNVKKFVTREQSNVPESRRYYLTENLPTTMSVNNMIFFGDFRQKRMTTVVIYFFPHCSYSD